VSLVAEAATSECNKPLEANHLLAFVQSDDIEASQTEMTSRAETDRFGNPKLTDGGAVGPRVR
jgi:hypothetical protein